MVAIIPELEKLKWIQGFPHATTFYWRDSDGYEDAFAGAARELSGRGVGVEAGKMRLFEADALRRHMGTPAVQDMDEAHSMFRISKSPSELKALSEAIRISEQALT